MCFHVHVHTQQELLISFGHLFFGILFSHSMFMLLQVVCRAPNVLMGRSFSNCVLNESGELVPYWQTIPPETREKKRWRMVEAYKENKKACYSRIAAKAKVSYALVARWLPVYKRTGGVVDNTKLGRPNTRTQKLRSQQRYGEHGITPKTKEHDKLHRIHARERMVDVYNKNKSASHNAIAKEARVSVGVVHRWLPLYISTGRVYYSNIKGLPDHL